MTQLRGHAARNAEPIAESVFVVVVVVVVFLHTTTGGVSLADPPHTTDSASPPRKDKRDAAIKIEGNLAQVVVDVCQEYKGV